MCGDFDIQRQQKHIPTPSTENILNFGVTLCTKKLPILYRAIGVLSLIKILQLPNNNRGAVARQAISPRLVAGSTTVIYGTLI